LEINLPIIFNKESMKRSTTLRITIALAVAAMIIPANAFSQRKAKEAPAKDGIKLEYLFPEGKALSYSTITNMAQTMDYQGQSVQANVLQQLSCTVTGKGKAGNDLKIEVLIDTMKQSVETPQGSAGGLMSDVMGKKFTMTITGSGKEIDLSEAEKIAIKTESVETNAGQSFADYFPDVPSQVLKPGDTWVSNDTLRSKSGTFSMVSIIKAENKFEGMEKLDGFDCARITSVISGTREQNAQTMGMDVATTGTFTGTAELLFAVKEGYYIKSSSVSKLSGTIEIGGAQNMSMPLVADITTLAKLKK
jgi:hypothetical protein